MKRTSYLLVVLVMLMVPLSQAATGHAQSTLEVAEAAVCRNVVDREPVDVGNTFQSSVGKLYCFSKISGASDPTQISHVWYYGDVERARVNLDVKSVIWRTYSSKIIQDHEIGDWHVDILGPKGELLMTLRFKITP